MESRRVYAGKKKTKLRVRKERLLAVISIILDIAVLVNSVWFVAAFFKSEKATAYEVTHTYTLGSGSIGYSNTTENIATDPSGTVYVAYNNGGSICIKTSRDSFTSETALVSTSAIPEIAYYSSGNCMVISYLDGGSINMLYGNENGFSQSIDNSGLSSSGSTVHMTITGSIIYMVDNTGENLWKCTSVNSIGGYEIQNEHTYVNADLAAAGNTVTVVVEDNSSIAIFRSEGGGEIFTPITTEPETVSLSGITVANVGGTANIYGNSGGYSISSSGTSLSAISAASANANSRSANVVDGNLITTYSSGSVYVSAGGNSLAVGSGSYSSATQRNGVIYVAYSSGGTIYVAVVKGLLDGYHLVSEPSVVQFEVGSSGAKPLILTNTTPNSIVINAITAPAGYTLSYVEGSLMQRSIAAGEEMPIKVVPTGVVSSNMVGSITVMYSYGGVNNTLVVPVNVYNDYTPESNIESKSTVATITYNATENRGTTTETSDIVEIGDYLDLTNKTATRTGCTFIGWNTDKDANSKITKMIVARDTTLYAIFYVPVSGLTLSDSTKEIEAGSIDSISVASFIPDDATDKSIIWSSSDESIAKVNESGLITAIYPGTTTITATATGTGTNSVVKASCLVTVKPRTYTLTYDAGTNGGSLITGGESTSEIVEEATTINLRGNIRGADYIRSGINRIFIGWNTDKDAKTGMDSLVIKEDNANESDTIVLYAIYEDMVVSVYDPEDKNVSNTTMTVAENQVIDLTALVTPNQYAPEFNLSWDSSDSSIAKINDGQLVMQTGSSGTSGIYITATATPTDPRYAQASTRVYLKITGAQCIITYDAKTTGGNEETKSESLIYGDEVEVITTGEYKATKTGYTHIGWAVSTTATTGITPPYYATGNATLYAVFEKVKANLDITALTLVEGDTQKLTATVTPAQTLDKSVTWVSSDESIATVDQNGNVQAIKPGQVSITATPISGTDETSVCTVVVEPRGYGVIYDGNGGESELESDTYPAGEAVDLNIQASITGEKFRGWATTPTATTPLTEYIMPNQQVTLYAVYEKYDVILDQESINFMEGQTSILNATVTPSDANPSTVHWEVEDETIATVDQNGKVTAIHRGETVVNAIADVDGTVFASCAIIVDPLAYLVSYNPGLGQSDATEEYVEYETEANLDFVATRENYRFKGWNTDPFATEGLTTLKVTKAETLYAIYEEILPEKITLDKEELTITVRETAKVNAVVTPEDALDKGIRWYSSNEERATVDSEGNITAISKGEVTITAESNRVEGLKAECRVTVEPVYYEISYDVKTNGGNGEISSLKVEEGTNANLDVIATKDDYVFAGWSLSSTATTKEECLTEFTPDKDTILYAIFVPLTISLDKTHEIIMERQSFVITATISPDFVADKSVTYESSDESVATVDSNGQVIGISPGVAIIKVKPVAGKNVEEICIVEVEDEIYTVTYDAETNGGESYIKNEDISYGDEADLTVPATKKHYYHIGWNTNPKATTGLDRLVVSGPVTLYAIYKVKVPEKIDLGEDRQIQIESHEYIDAVITPEDALDTSLTWSSTNESVATVDDHGRVDALALGTTIITATSNADNTVKKTIKVTVIKKRFNVVYNAEYNGGTSDVSSLIAVDGDKANLKVKASKYGSIFLGWNTDPNASEGLKEYTVKSNITLYAIYKKIQGDNKAEAVIESVTNGDSNVYVNSTSDMTLKSMTSAEKANVIAGALSVKEVSDMYAGKLSTDITIEITPNRESISSPDSILLLNMRDPNYVENIHFFNTDVYRTIKYTAGGQTKEELTTLDTPIDLTYIIPSEIVVREGRGFRMVAAHKDANKVRFATNYDDKDNVYQTITINIDKFCLMGLIYRDTPYDNNDPNAPDTPENPENLDNPGEPIPSDNNGIIDGGGGYSDNGGVNAGYTSTGGTARSSGMPYDGNSKNASYVVVGLSTATGDKPNIIWYIALCISALVCNLALKIELDKHKEDKKKT